MCGRRGAVVGCGRLLGLERPQLPGLRRGRVRLSRLVAAWPISTHLAVARGRQVARRTRRSSRWRRTRSGPRSSRRSSSSRGARRNSPTSQTGKRAPGSRCRAGAARQAQARDAQQVGAAAQARRGAVPRGRHLAKSQLDDSRAAPTQRRRARRELRASWKSRACPGARSRSSADRARWQAAQAALAQAQWKLDQKRVARPGRARLRHAVSGRRMGARPAVPWCGCCRRRT